MPRHWVPWSLTRAIQALAWLLATCLLFHLGIQSPNWPCITMPYWCSLTSEDSEMHHAYTMTKGIPVALTCEQITNLARTLVTESQTLIVAVNATISGCKTLSSRSWRINTHMGYRIQLRRNPFIKNKFPRKKEPVRGSPVTHRAQPAASRGLFPTRRTWHRNWWQCYERWHSLELWPP